MTKTNNKITSDLVKTSKDQISEMINSKKSFYFNSINSKDKPKIVSSVASNDVQNIKINPKNTSNNKKPKLSEVLKKLTKSSDYVSSETQEMAKTTNNLNFIIIYSSSRIPAKPDLNKLTALIAEF